MVFPFLSACLSPTNLPNQSHSPRVTAYSFLSSRKCDAHSVASCDFKLHYLAPSYLPFSKVFFFFSNQFDFYSTERTLFFSSFSRFLMIYSRNLSYSPSQIRYLFLFLLAFVIVLYTDAAAAAAKLPQSCPTLCNPIDGSPPGSPVPGILQARTLEWVAISFSNA